MDLASAEGMWPAMRTLEVLADGASPGAVDEAAAHSAMDTTPTRSSVLGTMSIFSVVSVFGIISVTTYYLSAPIISNKVA